mmetsp:Transcript_16773/g.28617  ORF Transcript_16773/g.28617 Transcript_16773/m.28617 type:complete len:375 (+) Transcript_16773:54-1178(+)
MAGDLPRQGYAGVTSHFPACGWARAELALNQDKSRLQLRRSGSPVNQARSFKFTACAVSDAPGALSPRSAAIVPGRRSNSPVLRGLKVGEIISVLRERSPDGGSAPGASESMVWPHRRGDENLIAASGFQLGRLERRARSASPPRGRARENMEEARMVAMFAAVSTEQEVEVDVLNLGASVGGRDGRTRPLSPRVRESDWLDGLSSRMAERGGSRLFPTHLAKSAKVTGGSKAGGAFVVSGGPKAAEVTGSSGKQRSPKTAPKKMPSPKVATKAREPRTSKALNPVEKIASGKTAEVQRAHRGSREAKIENDAPGVRKVEKMPSTPPTSENATKEASPRADSKESSKGLSKLQLLRKRLEDTMRAAEGIVPPKA